MTLVVIVRLSLRIRRFARDSLTASLTVPPGRTANGLRARTTSLLALLSRLTRIFRTLVNVALPVSAPVARKVNVKPPPRLTLITDFEPAKRARASGGGVVVPPSPPPAAAAPVP